MWKSLHRHFYPAQSVVFGSFKTYLSICRTYARVTQRRLDVNGLELAPLPSETIPSPSLRTRSMQWWIFVYNPPLEQPVLQTEMLPKREVTPLIKRRTAIWLPVYRKPDGGCLICGTSFKMFQAKWYL